MKTWHIAVFVSVTIGLFYFINLALDYQLDFKPNQQDIFWSMSQPRIMRFTNPDNLAEDATINVYFSAAKIRNTKNIAYYDDFLLVLFEQGNNYKITAKKAIYQTNNPLVTISNEALIQIQNQKSNESELYELRTKHFLFNLQSKELSGKDGVVITNRYNRISANKFFISPKKNKIKLKGNVKVRYYLK